MSILTNIMFFLLHKYICVCIIDCHFKSNRKVNLFLAKMRPGRGQDFVEDPIMKKQQCLNATVIVAATITDFKPGMQTRSMPP